MRQTGKREGVLCEADVWADMQKTEKQLLLRYATALGEENPQMVRSELLRFMEEAAEDCRTASSEKACVDRDTQDVSQFALNAVLSRFRREKKQLIKIMD